MSEVTREEFRRYILSAEGEELPKLAPEEAFEATKRGDFSTHSLAGRTVAYALLRFFERHPEINPQDTYYIAKDYIAKEGKIRIDDVLDEQARKEIEAIGPTGAMFGWALGSVKWLLEK